MRVENKSVSKIFIYDFFVEKYKLRWIILLALILISIALNLYERGYFNLKDEDESNTNAISDEIVSLLLNRPYFISNQKLNRAVPDSVLDFVDFSEMFKHEEALVKNNDIVIYEIVDQLDNDRKIDFFLTEAKELLSKDKLTTPKGNSAVDKFEAVLAMDSTNATALIGIKKIVDRYSVLADLAIKKNQSFKVAGYIKKAFIVGEGYIEMSPLMKKYKSYLDDDRVFLQVELEGDSKQDLIDSHNIDTTISATRTIVDIDYDFAKVAANLIANNDFSGAERVLLRFTELSHYWGQSYDQLFTIYIKQFSFKQAKELINSNPFLDTYQLAEKVAKLFIVNNDKVSALSLLESHSPDMKNYTEIYAIKAGLYIELGQYEKASKIYRQLISIDFSNFRYWLGLAISLDAISDAKTLEAFKFAKQYSNRNQIIQDYVGQRIFALTTE